MDSNSDSDTEFSSESFRIVRHCATPSKPRPDQEGADAVPVPTMAALSPDPPASPMSEDDDAQSQPLSGTDQEGADGVDTSMAMVRWSPDPPPRRSESGSSRSRLRPPYKSVETTIVDDYSKRRRALTKDEEALFQKCNPGMQPLHLYGGTDRNWEVKPPDFSLPPPEPPEPTLIEQGRLLAVLTGQPTVHEILLANSDMYHVEEKRTSVPKADASVEEEKEEEHYAEEKRSSGPHEAYEVVKEQYINLIEEQRASGPSEANEMLEEAEEDVTNDDDNFCASCNSRYNKNGFWICCNSCEKWYHGKCVNITSSEAEHMEHFECHDCYAERYGHDD